MKTLRVASAAGVVILMAGMFLGLTFLSRAQTQDTSGGTPLPDSVVRIAAEAQGLSLAPPDQLPESGGTFWIVAGEQSLAPYPFLPARYGPESTPIYSLGLNSFLVDGTTNSSRVSAAALDAEGTMVLDFIDEIQVVQANAELSAALGQGRMMTMNSSIPSFPGDGDDGGGTNYYGGSTYTFTIDTNALWLEITNVANGLASVNLHNGTNPVYAVWSTTDLLAGWQVEREVWPTNGTVIPTVTPFTVPTLDRQNLFLRAQDWTGVTENGNTAPDWWLWLYFGTTALSDTSLDGGGVNTLLYDYTNQLDPNIIRFSIAVSNNYVNSSQTSAQLAVSGVPYYIAVSVDDTNHAVDAVWNNYTSSSASVSLGTAEGWHGVWIGLRGHADDASAAVWQYKRLKLDLTPPVLAITSPTNNLVTQPVLQLTGFSPEALFSISCDISNAVGVATNRQVLVLDQYHDTNTWEFTTNWFQAFDVPLTNGVNLITLHASDLAGNVTTTNFSFTLDYSSATNPPVVRLDWPLNGVAVCGDSFTCHGSVSDPTATVTVQVTDTNGNIRILNAAVGRDGNFWAEGLSLGGGVNSLTLSATDAAGNVTTTSLTVAQGNFGLGINPVSAGQTTVTGGIGANGVDCTIWVNGSQATKNGDGTWTAQITPIGIGGGTVEAMAIPSSDNGGNGSGGSDSCGNPTSAQGQAVQTLVAAPEGAYISKYRNHQEYEFTPYWYYGEYVEPPHEYDRLDWQDGQGGGEGTYSVGYELENGGVYFPLLTATTWPATEWPQALPAGTEAQTSWWYGNDFPPVPSTTVTNIASAPSLAMERCDITQNNPLEIYQRKADAQINLATGGKAGSTRMNLWSISARAWAQFPPWSPVYGDYFARWGGASNAPIASSRITIRGNPVGSDGKLYMLLPDNADPDITPAIAGAPDYYTFDVTATKYALTILAGSSTTNADLSAATPEFCVGQLVTFGLNWSVEPPYEPEHSYFHWHLPDKFVNEPYQPYASSTCTSYRRNDDWLAYPTTHCWYVNGNGGPCSVGMNLLFTNGQAVSIAAMGNFTVYRPQMTAFTDYPPFTPMITNGWLELGDDGHFGAGNNYVGKMNFFATVESKTNFPGTANWTQLVNRSTTYATSTSGYWLDNGQIFNGMTDVNPRTIPPFSLVDNPGVGSVWAYVSVTDAYKSYLVFKPGGDAIGVTLGIVTWGWSGTETLGALTSPSVTPPTYTDSDEFPVWPNVLQSTRQ